MPHDLVVCTQEAGQTFGQGRIVSLSLGEASGWSSEGSGLCKDVNVGGCGQSGTQKMHSLFSKSMGCIYIYIYNYTHTHIYIHSIIYI